MTPTETTYLNNVQRRYGAEVFWDDGDAIHRCGGQQLHPGVFLLWPICRNGDVPAGKGFKSPDVKATCMDCIGLGEPGNGG